MGNQKKILTRMEVMMMMNKNSSDDGNDDDNGNEIFIQKKAKKIYRKIMIIYKLKV